MSDLTEAEIMQALAPVTIGSELRDPGSLLSTLEKRLTAVLRAKGRAGSVVPQLKLDPGKLTAELFAQIIVPPSN